MNQSASAGESVAQIARRRAEMRECDMCELTKEYTDGLRHQAAVEELERADFLRRPSVMLGVKPHLDGNKWCALYGVNLQEGVSGFGDSPDEAMKAFDEAWREKIK